MINGAELGGATGAMAPLVFWSGSLKKSRNQSLVVLSGTSCFYLRSAPMLIYLSKNKQQLLVTTYFHCTIFLIFWSTVSC